MKEKYVKILLKLAKKAYKKNEIPVSAIIVYKDKILAKAYNKKNLCKNPLLHAEVLCINKSCKKLKTWNLSECKLYVSLEPCDMCKEIISEARISKVYYILEKGKITNKYAKTTYEQMYVKEDRDFSGILKDFFNKIRN